MLTRNMKITISIEKFEPHLQYTIEKVIILQAFK